MDGGVKERYMISSLPRRRGSVISKVVVNSHFQVWQFHQASCLNQSSYLQCNHRNPKNQSDPLARKNQ